MKQQSSLISTNIFNDWVEVSGQFNVEVKSIGGCGEKIAVGDTADLELKGLIITYITAQCPLEIIHNTFHFTL